MSYEILLNAMLAVATQKQEFADTGKWHVDCNCEECRTIQKWQDLSKTEKQQAWDEAKRLVK